MSRRVLVLLLLPVFLGLSRGIAEASRYDFSGAGNEEIIVWDGDFEVSTESNNCGAGGCSTLPPTLPMFGFILTGAGAEFTTMNRIGMVLMSSNVACGANPDCGAFSDFFTAVDGEVSRYLYDPDGNPNTDNSLTLSWDDGRRNPPGTPPGGLAAPNVFFAWLNLPGGLSYDGQVFDSVTECPNPSPCTDMNLLNLFLGASDLRTGLVAEFSQVPPGFSSVPFSLTQIGGVDAAPVPEPATLTLLGTGIAAAVVRRRRARR